MRVRYAATAVMLSASISLSSVLGNGIAGYAAGSDAVDCSALGIGVKGDQQIKAVSLPPHQSCAPRTSNGFPIPDPNCTPGAINPTLTVNVLSAPTFTTKCVRDHATTANQKNQTYDWYGIEHPAQNTGKTQTCELDHLISLELGGADTLDNIWPQCGPDGVTLPARYFKMKDTVENYLAAEVKAGRMDLGGAQRGIATDWTQFLHPALDACPGGRCTDNTRVTSNTPR